MFDGYCSGYYDRNFKNTILMFLNNNLIKYHTLLHTSQFPRKHWHFVFVFRFVRFFWVIEIFFIALLCAERWIRSFRLPSMFWWQCARSNFGNSLCLFFSCFCSNVSFSMLPAPPLLAAHPPPYTAGSDGVLGATVPDFCSSLPLLQHIHTITLSYSLLENGWKGQSYNRLCSAVFFLPHCPTL